MEERGKDARRGLVYITAVYLVWGVLPAYWKLMRTIDPIAIIGHRALWSFVCVAAVSALVLRPKRLLEPLKDRRTFLLFLLASLSLVAQWVAYLLAIVTDRLVDLSLGYFIYPIAVVFLGRLFLKEKMTFPQKISLGLACVGVLIKVLQFKSVPVLALCLALSFSAYSIIKKKIGLNAAESIFYELLFMLPFALGYVAYTELTGSGLFLSMGSRSALLLVGGGVLTAATLLLFAAGARRIPIFVVGFLQYISPTIVLVLGVLVYGEPFGMDQSIVFGLIWIALIVSIAPSALAAIRKAKPAKAP